MFEAHFGHLIPQRKRVKIPDLVCGSGAFVSWLQSKGYKSVGDIDISPEQIYVGKECKVKNLRRGYVFTFLGDKEEGYDAIAAHDLIEHFEKNRILALLELIYRALKSGGKCAYFNCQHRISIQRLS
ncbi:MAG TPA: class I SAM-dependent methyltransferase [Candidatus Scalindua sp.]|nr:class I SAM-dependent methyltransferase [Candidatus Scalindua sp.]